MITSAVLRMFGYQVSSLSSCLFLDKKVFFHTYYRNNSRMPLESMGYLK